MCVCVRLLKCWSCIKPNKRLDTNCKLLRYVLSHLTIKLAQSIARFKIKYKIHEVSDKFINTSHVSDNIITLGWRKCCERS